MRPDTGLLPHVRRLAVLRPNAVGDFVFALPALHALRQAYPEAHIVYLGKPWHVQFLQGRPGPVDEVIAMPPVPGVGAPPYVDPEPGRHFAEKMRATGIDLALQLYGGGHYSNPYLRTLGARHTVGLRTPDAAPLDRWLPYGELANRRLELLQVAALAGATPAFSGRELEATEEDRRLAAELVPPHPGERIVVLHPGASDVRRRWPAERFAAIGDMLAERGATIVLSATADEHVLARAVAAHMHHAPLDLTGRLSLSALCGLLERSVLMVANDTGPLHLALALETPAVGIFWLTNLVESGPLVPHLLGPALSVKTRCPVCGTTNRKNARCAHDVCFVDDVSIDEVRTLALQLFEESLPRRAGARPRQALRTPFRRKGHARSGAAPGRAVPSA